jgi:hypothetical protein
MFSPRLYARLKGKLFNYTLQGTIPGAVGSPGTANPSKTLDTQFHFLSGAMQTLFNTLSAAATDSGVNTISAQFRSDQSNNFLSDDFIDLAAIAAPGRQRTVAVAGDPSQSLRIPGLPWFYPYRAGSAIAIDLRNTSTQALSFTFNFQGMSIPVSEFPTIEDVMQVLAEYDPGYGIPSIPAMTPHGFMPNAAQNQGFPSRR